MPLDRAAIESALKAKGFKPSDGDHKYFCYYTSQDKKTPIFTKTSHGTKYKTLTDGLVSQMSKQCKLTAKQFRDLVECSLSREAYETVLVSNNHITLDLPASDKEKK